MTEKKSNIESELVAEAYASAVEPSRHEMLMEVWSSYLEHSLSANDSNQHMDLNEEILFSHFKRAHRIFSLIDSQRSVEKGAKDLADSVTGFGLVVTADGQIVAMNDSALRLVGSAIAISGLRMDQGAISQVRAWIAAPAQNKSVFLFTPFYTENDDGYLFTAEVNINSDSIPSELGPIESSERFFLVSSVELQLTGEALKEVGKVLKLTIAESQVAADLCNGRAPSDIASSRSVSINTVRSQIKSIQQKTNSKTSLEVVRKLCAFASNTYPGSSALQTTVVRRKIDSHRRSGSLVLADGRRLSYCDQGDPNGRVVLFFHNMAFDVELNNSVLEASAEAKWRIIAPSRPGYGETEGHSSASGSDLLNLAADDAAQLLAHLSISNVLVLGHVMGSIYAQRFASKYKGLCRGLLFVSHVPYWSENLLAHLPARHRMLAQTTILKPEALSLVLRAGAALINSGREEVLIRAIHNNVPCDKMALENSEILQVVKSGMQHAARQGYQAFQKDCEIVTSEWLAESRNIDVPVTVLHGGGDHIVTKEHIEYAANEIPVLKIVSVQEAGQYLLYSHWANVQEQLEYLDENRYRKITNGRSF